MLWRWIFTVPSDMLSRAATSLFDRPSAISRATSFSRRVSSRERAKPAAPPPRPG